MDRRGTDKRQSDRDRPTEREWGRWGEREREGGERERERRRERRETEREGEGGRKERREGRREKRGSILTEIQQRNPDTEVQTG